jgi:hypothetical protein
MRVATDVVAEAPLSVPAVKPNPERPALRLGVGLLRWSPDGQFVVSRNGTPTAHEEKEGRCV